MGDTEHCISPPVPVMRGAQLRTHLRWRVVAAVFLLGFITIVDRVCISSAKLSIAAELHIPDVQFGWVFGAFAVGYAIAMIPSGWLGDRIAPRAFLALNVCCWSLFTACTGLVTGLTALLVVRLLFGLAEAGVYPTASRALYNWMPVSERGSALGLLNAGSRLGAALGLAIASWIILSFTWRVCFLLLGAAGLTWAVCWYFWYHDDPAEQRGISAEELDYIRKPAERSSEQRQRPGAWKQQAFSVSGCLLLFQYFANNFSLFLVYSWMLPYLQQRFLVQPARAGIYSGLPMYCGVAATFGGGVLIDGLFRRGFRSWSRAIPAAGGFLLAALGVALAGLAASPGWFVFWIAIVVLGLDSTVSSSWTVCSDIGREHTATVSAAMNMAGSLGSFACAIVFPYAVHLTGRADAFFWIAAALNLAGLCCWLRLGARLAERRPLLQAS